MAEGTAREFVAFDLETTGLVAQVDRVVEIGAVRFDASGRELARFESLVNPERPMLPRRKPCTGFPTPTWPVRQRPGTSCPDSSSFWAIPRSRR